MRITRTRVIVVALCALLCAGVAWGKKDTATGSFDRQAILDHNSQDRDGSKNVAAASLQLAHAKQLLANGDTAGAVDLLNLIARMDLPDARPAERTLVDAFLLLGEIYSEYPGRASVKAAAFLDHAVRHMDPELDSQMLQTAIRDAARIFEAAGNQTQSLRMQQLAEDVAAGRTVRDLGLMPAAPGTVEDAGDDNCGDAVAVVLDHLEKMNIDSSGDHNWRSFSVAGPTVVRIETNSDDIFGDDTDLTLWGTCTAIDTPDDFVVFDDDGGPGFLSLIELCVPAGEYFVEVGGFADFATPDDFDFAITDLGPCVVPPVDGYESDDESSEANSIGFRNNGNGQGNQTGRDNSQVQEHTIFPFGDIDFVTFTLSRNSRVRMETFGDGNPDTVIGFSNSGGQLLATNDDKGPGDFGSRLDLCLPAGSDWLLATIGFSTADLFTYNLAVDVEGACLFEQEPNGDCSDLDTKKAANRLEPGSVYSGLQTAAGVAEDDWWYFTLEETGFVTIATDGWDDFDVDTFLELWGPGCPGDLIAADDDNGPGFLSEISAELGPGTYYVNATVSPFSVGANYPYDITLEISEPPLTETEPNDSCAEAAANAPFFLGDDVLASISPSGDRDHYTLSLAGDSNVLIETDGPSGDTVLQIESADGSTVIGCDDDGGPGLFSGWSCCIPAGDYCVVVRDFGDNSTISTYNITFTDLGSCNADDPPVCDVSGLGCPF